MKTVSIEISEAKIKVPDYKKIQQELSNAMDNMDADLVADDAKLKRYRGNMISFCVDIAEEYGHEIGA